MRLFFIATYSLFFLVSGISAHSEVYTQLTLEQKEVARSLFLKIRCPSCQGEAIKDSETQEAIRIKEFIVGEIISGKSEEEIVDYIRQSYGDEILFQPKFEESTYILWVAPFFLLIVGLLLLFRGRFKG